ncbi:MAG TPA: hypothetical protein DCY88_01905 [Cyanobacteria bacterium UBA11372]|nr:hypothetical protein [Cyanobacteria bacterium UBA11372]
MLVTFPAALLGRENARYICPLAPSFLPDKYFLIIYYILGYINLSNFCNFSTTPFGWRKNAAVISNLGIVIVEIEENYIDNFLWVE